MCSDVGRMCCHRVFNTTWLWRPSSPAGTHWVDGILCPNKTTQYQKEWVQTLKKSIIFPKSLLKDSLLPPCLCRTQPCVDLIVTERSYISDSRLFCVWKQHNSCDTPSQIIGQISHLRINCISLIQLSRLLQPAWGHFCMRAGWGAGGGGTTRSTSRATAVPLTWSSKDKACPTSRGNPSMTIPLASGIFMIFCLISVIVVSWGNRKKQNQIQDPRHLAPRFVFTCSKNTLLHKHYLPHVWSLQLSQQLARCLGVLANWGFLKFSILTLSHFNCQNHRGQFLSLLIIKQKRL